MPDLSREHGMSSASFYKWRAKYGGMDAALMTRMKDLDAENARLKKRCMRKNGSRPKFRKRLSKKSGEAISSA